MIEHIKANSEMVVVQMRQLSGTNFDYNLESVEWLEGYVERLRSSGQFESEEDKRKLTSVFGSFLGEAIIHCFGGKWVDKDGTWAVAFSPDGMAFPFSKVAKQMDNGLEDGIASFFNAIPLLFEGSVCDPYHRSQRGRGGGFGEVRRRVMSSQRPELLEQVANQGWLMSPLSENELDWWADEMVRLKSAWSPLSAEAYLTFLVDPQLPSPSQRKRGENVWAVLVSNGKPSNWLGDVNSFTLSLGPGWKKGVPDLIEFLDRLRRQATPLN
jgi:hypothetical protein